MKQVGLSLNCFVNIDLYQKTTCIMKQVSFKIITSQNWLVSENDLSHEMGKV